MDFRALSINTHFSLSSMLSDLSDWLPDVPILDNNCSDLLSLPPVASRVTIKRSLLFSCFLSFTSFSCPFRLPPCEGGTRFLVDLALQRTGQDISIKVYLPRSYTASASMDFNPKIFMTDNFTIDKMHKGLTRPICNSWHANTQFVFDKEGLTDPPPQKKPNYH